MLNFYYTPYALPLIGTTLVAGLLCLYAWRHRQVAGAISFALLTLAIAQWSLTYAFEIAGTDLPTKVFWGKVQYFGIVTAPLAWLFFALQYTQQTKWLTRYRLALISLEPVITILLALTTESHGLIWTQMILDNSGEFLVLDVTHGAWFWIHTAYSYLLMLVGTALIVRWVSRSPGLYGSQVGALLIGVTLPWLGNIIYVSGLNPWTGLDITPFTLTLTSIAFAWAIFRFHLLDLAPLARNIVVENLKEGMIVLDVANRVVDLNPAAANLLNVSLATVIGQPIARLLEAQPFLVERYLNVPEVVEEISLSTRAGQRDFELQISPLLNARKETAGRVVVVRDITDRKRAAERLRRYNKQLDTLYAITLDLLSYQNTEGLLQLIVDRAADLLEAPYCEVMLVEGDELIVRAFTKNQTFLSGDRVRRGEARLSWQAYDSRQPVTVDNYSAWAEHRSLYDELRLQAVVSVPIQTGDTCWGVLDLGRVEPGYAFDEEQIRLLSLFARLVALVLTNTTLYTQNLEANRLKGKLLANVSHDVRTPLSVVLLHTSMLNSGLRGPITPEQNKSLISIASSANLILDFVNNLIGQAEIESGQVRLALVPFMPQTLVETLYATPRDLAHMKGLELAITLAPDLPEKLMGDLYRLRQILLNLVSNAIKFTTQGQVNVRLYQPDEMSWALEVADTGLGIPPEAQTYIFEAFQKIEDDAHMSHLGSGLGLSIVKELTHLMGGRILLASEVGRGSVFTLTFPLLPLPKEDL